MYFIFGRYKKRFNFEIMENDKIKIKLTGKQVATLKKGKEVTYLNPVAQERAKIMEKHYNYVPLIQDVFTLKPNSYYEN